LDSEGADRCCFGIEKPVVDTRADKSIGQLADLRRFDCPIAAPVFGRLQLRSGLLLCSYFGTLLVAASLG
jgi:hypothetical protein